ncbi:MAG: divergent PAP2 family protein [Clostridia bacterium]|nr:divergent PAP2 family protein [Clostridia bacterium]MBQ8333218.1 divergent PAP2 family protein [Clostridia bacterium]MBQ8369532.1 divergent PAP2 family protein [Clostridia bacterium]MBQ8511930.1 divergent PAP2 family protein [Clostridia bacterium]
MNWFLGLLHNPFFLTATTSWLAAQILKTIIHSIVNRKFDYHRLFGDGGMPSGHSATVTSLGMLVSLVYGTDSLEFAVCAIFAIVVCHDAMGVRLETGKQAVVLNELIEMIEHMSKTDILPEVKLKEFVGHTPVQVLAGILLGIVNAVIMYNIMY